MTNKELAHVFATIANLLEIKGEVIYKILAYRRAAEIIAEYPRPIRDVWRQGRLREVPGVGPAIAEKVDELLSSGRLAFFERLKQDVPVSLAEMLQVQDLGPKRVALIWKKLGVTTLAELELAARTGKLRNLSGMGEKSEAKILAGIEARRHATARMPIGQAWPVAQEILKYLRGIAGVKAAETAGSLRRMRATVGDLDFLVAAEDSRPVVSAFGAHHQVARVLVNGPTKISVELDLGLQADLRVLPPERFGTLLQYFTGSKDHNVRLRELAQSRGLSLSENAFVRKDGREILCASEAEVYRTLGLPYIPPELREDRGEFEAALANRLPRLVEARDLQSDLHTHTHWSDGQAGIREMAMAARARGLRCLAITDHSQSLGVAGGLSVDRLRQQRREMDSVQAELGTNFSLLHGAEVEIRADGRLDFGDDMLEDLDIVVASLHTSLRQERGQITERLLHAIRNRHVDIIGHPTGRLLPDREGADLDMEVILQAAAQHGVALEVNANPQRLDLDDVHIKRALELGCLVSINTDAHQPEHFGFAHFGVGTARRGWATADNVINAWPLERLFQWLDERGHRRPRPASRPADLGGSRPAPMTGAKVPARPLAGRSSASGTAGIATSSTRPNAVKGQPAQAAAKKPAQGAARKPAQEAAKKPARPAAKKPARPAAKKPARPAAKKPARSRPAPRGKGRRRQAT